MFFCRLCFVCVFWPGDHSASRQYDNFFYFLKITLHQDGSGRSLIRSTDEVVCDDLCTSGGVV